MGVTIDESGQNQPAFGIDRLRGQIFALELAARPNRNNRVTLHNNDSVVVDGSGSIHGYDGSSGYDQIGLLFCPLRPERGENKELEGKNKSQRSTQGHSLPQRLEPRLILSFQDSAEVVAKIAAKMPAPQERIPATVSRLHP
jgi:hypothetical protein